MTTKTGKRSMLIELKNSASGRFMTPSLAESSDYLPAALIMIFEFWRINIIK
jgi:hypothetical protein